MKKFLFLLGLSTALPTLAQAEGFEFAQSGLAGQYYGIMETKKHDNLNNMPNRLVTRVDGAVSGLYRFADDSTLGAYANYTFVYRQHDKDYNDGDWRFYPYLQGESKQLGRLSIGYTYGAAFQLHGTKDLTAGKKPGSVRDCNEMTLFRGCSVGFHSHNGVGEVIYVLHGEGVYSDGEAETHVRAGDALVCFDGEGHAIRNEREAPLKILAFIVAE